MHVYIILLIIGGISFIASLVIWFISGIARKRNIDASRNDDRIGGFLFMSSLVVFFFALLACLIW